MERIRLTSPVEVNDLVGSRWSPDGPIVVYDGLGLEDEARPPVLRVACPWCGEEVSVAVADVLCAERVAFDPELVDAYGLDTLDGPGPPRPMAGLGLTPYALRDRCERCHEDFMAVIGYGEKQPARYMAVYHGVAAIDAIDEAAPGSKHQGRLKAGVARTFIVALVVALPVLVAWFHWSTWSEISTHDRLVVDGVEVVGEVVATRESHTPRSVDRYWVTVSYAAEAPDGGATGIEREIEVDVTSYGFADVGEPIELVYDAADPYRVDIVGNGVSFQRIVLLVITDLLLVVVGAVVFRQARRAGRGRSG